MMNKELLKEIDAHLYDWGFRKNSGARKGWYWTIRADGPPGLTHDEQEINRRGGRYCGNDSIGLLKETGDDIRGTLVGFADDEIEESSRLTFERDWLIEADRLLRLASDNLK